ncbi:hypothetical protein GCM10028864_24950 [Microlunatus parietis]
MAVLAGAALVVFGGCAVAEEPPIQGGEPGTWELLDAGSVTARTTVLRLGVTRVDCSGGVTGKVLEPKVIYEQTRIVIETEVEALNLKAANCPGNPQVPTRLELSEPIGQRDLIDGYCIKGEAVPTSFCVTAVRRPGH